MTGTYSEDNSLGGDYRLLANAITTQIQRIIKESKDELFKRVEQLENQRIHDDEDEDRRRRRDSEDDVSEKRIEREIKDEWKKLRKIIEKELREKEMRAKELREKEMRAKELREKEIREKDLREKEMREKELREKEKASQDKEIKEKEMKERQMIEKESEKGKRKEKEKNEYFSFHSDPLFVCEDSLLQQFEEKSSKGKFKTLNSSPNLDCGSNSSSEFDHAPNHINSFVLIPREELFIKEQWTKQFGDESISYEEQDSHCEKSILKQFGDEMISYEEQDNHCKKPILSHTNSQSCGLIDVFTEYVFDVHVTYGLHNTCDLRDAYDRHNLVLFNGVKSLRLEMDLTFMMFDGFFRLVFDPGGLYI